MNLRSRPPRVRVTASALVPARACLSECSRIKNSQSSHFTSHAPACPTCVENRADPVNAGHSRGSHNCHYAKWIGQYLADQRVNRLVIPSKTIRIMADLALRRPSAGGVGGVGLAVSDWPRWWCGEISEQFAKNH